MIFMLVIRNQTATVCYVTHAYCNRTSSESGVEVTN